MGDRKPPRLAGDELKTMLALLQFQRESLVRKADGVSEVQATWSPVASGTSLRWLIEHVARAEWSWVERRFAGAGGPDRADPVSMVEAVERYREQWGRTDAIARSCPLDQHCAADDAEPPVSLRWILAHLLEETARHAGHADILRELLDGDTGR